MSTPSLVTLGETMICFRCPPGQTLSMTRSVDLSIAGAESNVAIGAARLGTPVSWIGRVGNDEFGHLITRTLRSEAVGIDHVSVDEVAGTGLMFKERRTSTSARVWYRRSGSAGSHLSLTDAARAQISDADWLHVTGITPALSEQARTAVIDAVEAALTARTRISFDVNHRQALWPQRADASAMYRWIASRSDLVLAGPEEAALIVEEGGPEQMAADIGQLGPDSVVVKLGSRGAVAAHDGETHFVDAWPTLVIDPVGAGDAFAAGLLSEIIAGRTFSQSLTTASKMGAWAVGAAGDWEGLPYRPELDFLTEDPDFVRR